jgi:hypothetical protein
MSRQAGLKLVHFTYVELELIGTACHRLLEPPLPYEAPVCGFGIY